MNQARVWLVVKPSVGLPLFLGTVTTIALLVHGALLLSTDWFSAYWNGGKAKAKHTVSAPGTTAAEATPPAAK
jgi:light-harvesting protein B-800-850 alpha chain